MELIEIMQHFPGKQLSVGAAHKLSARSLDVDERVLRELAKITRDRRVIDRNDVTRALMLSWQEAKR